MNNIDINQADFNELQNIALEMFEKFVYNRANLSQEEFEKELRTYTRRILNVNLAKDGIDNAKIDIKSIDKKKAKNVNGSMSFKEDYGKKDHSALKINFNKIINGSKRGNKGLSSPSTKVRMETITRFVETIQHEYRHYKQERATRLNEDYVGYTAEEKYLISKEYASMGIKKRFFYKLKNNYKNFFIEADARLSGKTESLMICKKAYILTKELIRAGKLKRITQDDVDKDAFDRAVSRETNDIVMSNEMSLFDSTGNRNKIINNAATMAIASDSSILKTYPLLNIEYYKDGSKKPIDEIIKIENRELKSEADPEIKGQIYDCFNKIYSERILYGKNKELQETTKRLGKEEMATIFNRCQEYNYNDYMKKKQDLHRLKNDTQCIINKNTFTTTSRYNEYMNSEEKKMDKVYNDIEQRLGYKEKIASNVRGVYNKKSQINRSLSEEKADNKKYKNRMKIFKRPMMFLYRVSEVFDRNKKQERRGVDPSTLRRKKFMSDNNFEYYDIEDVDLDSKKKELREKKDIRAQKLALLQEAKDCYRESEKYLNLKNKNIGKSR